MIFLFTVFPSAYVIFMMLMPGTGEVISVPSIL